MRIISTSSRCSKVPGVRIQPARSSCRRGEFGRSRVEHKERIKAEDTSFNHAPPVLTEDWGERGVAELGFCFWLLFRGQTLTTTRSWTIERSFQSVLMTLYIWGAVRALTYIHSWLVTAIIRRVFFATAVSWAQREALWTEVHFKWFVLRVQSRAAIATWFYIHGKTEVASFLPFETNAMEWTYWSIVLLGCIFLDWALLTSAEEGKSGVFLRMLSRLIFCGCMTEWDAQLTLSLVPSKRKHTVIDQHATQRSQRIWPKSQGNKQRNAHSKIIATTVKWC